MIFNQQNIYIIYFHHTSQQHPWIFQQNPAFFASSLARSRRWLCTNCRSRLANWLAQTRQTHLGLDERLYEQRPGTWRGTFLMKMHLLAMATYGNIWQHQQWINDG
jgi:hypothetical protein